MASIAGAAALVIGTFKAMAAISELAAERLAELVKLGERAEKLGIGTDFMQRMTKSAEEAKFSTEELDKAIKKLAEDLRPTFALEGKSPFQKAIEELTEAGNLKGNRGLAQLAAANTVEQQWRAVLVIMTEALQKGERLAALSLAERFLPSSVVERLRANSDYMAEIQKNADKIAATELVSPEELARAADLKRRLEEAEKILSDKWKPVMDLLIQLGIDYREGWISFLGVLARGAETLSTILSIATQIADTVARIGNAPFLGGTPRQITPAEEETLKGLGVTLVPTNVDERMRDARERLRTGLMTPGAIERQQAEGAKILDAVRKDQSQFAKEEEEAARKRLDSIENYISRLQRVNEELAVAIRFEGQSNIERERALALVRAEHEARKERRELTDAERQRISALGAQHGQLQTLQAQLRETAETWRYFGQTAANALADIVIEGRNVQEVFQGILKMLARAALQSLFTGTGPLAALLGTSPASQGLAPGGVGGIFGLFRSMITPRQHGGPVSSGQPYLVGERGPELFVPRSAGIIAPRGAGGSSISITSNVDARGSTMNEGQFRMILAESNRQLERRILEAVPARMAYQRANGT
jgi:hypothetical protein